jgi:alpha-galactosidase
MAHLGSGKAALPFSFVYGGKSSSELLAQWEFKTGSRELDEMRTERTLTWSDPRSRLTVRCVAIEYDDFPAVEWTLYFKNEGNGRSPLLKDIQALDAQFEREQGDGPAGTPAFVLHGAQAPLGLDIGGLTSGTSHDRSNTLSYPPASGCGRWESGLATVPH